MASSSSPHSAQVSLQLLVEGRHLPLSHVGPDQVRLRCDAEFTTQDATILVTVDGIERRYPVRLADGVRLGEREVRIVPVEAG